VTWGWGAVALTTVAKGTVLECCRRRTRKEEGLHVYLFGPPRCTPCAFHFHAAVPHDPELLGHEEDR